MVEHKHSKSLIVVDTMVFAYSLLQEKRYYQEATRVFECNKTIMVPDSLRVEMANVVWQWVVHRDINKELAMHVLTDTEALVSHFISSSLLWQQALTLSTTHNHPVYDTLFVALAQLLETQLVTYDKKLLRLFPNDAITPATLLN